MFDENQLVEIYISSNNKKHFSELGYKDIKKGQTITVKASELMCGSSALVSLKCDYCGNEYQSQYCSVYKQLQKSQKQACQYCAGKKSRDLDLEKRRDHLYEKLTDFCCEFGYSLLTKKDDIVNAKSSVEYICPTHGLKRGTVDSLAYGRHVCIDCSYEKRGLGLRKSIDEVANEINSVNNNHLLNPDEYEGVFTRNLRIRCSCGNIFTTSYLNYVKAKVQRCPVCTQKTSKGEFMIECYLTSVGISYEREKRFDDCRDVKPLPFDFYIPKYNLIVEFDGQHHYFDVYGEEFFERTKRHDKIKDDYCAENRINLLRIPYYDGSNIKDLIASEISKIENNSKTQAQDIV